MDASSESTQAKRGVEAPVLITPKHLGNNIEQQKGIPIKGENDPKDSNNRRLARERVTQRQNNESRGNQGPSRVNNPPGNGGGGDYSGGTSGDQRFSGEERGPPRRNGNQRGGGGDDDPDPSDDGVGMISPPLQTPLSQRKENRRDPNMFMYSKDLLVQKVKKVNLDKQEEMVEMGKISP